MGRAMYRQPRTEPEQQPTIGSTNPHPVGAVRGTPTHQLPGNRISKAAGQVGGAMTREWWGGAADDQRSAVTETRALRKQLRSNVFAEGHDRESVTARLNELSPKIKVKGARLTD